MSAAVQYTAIFDRSYGASLLPVIPPNAPLSPNSTIRPEQTGKIPGRKNAATGLWSSFAWQRAPAPTRAEVDRWQQDGASLGMLGKAFPALDCDLNDRVLARKVRELAQKHFPGAPVRFGHGEHFLMVCRSDAPLRKQRFSFLYEGKPQAIELLGDKQYFNLEGEHPKGGRYAWRDGWGLDQSDPKDLPRLTPEKFVAWVAAIRAEFGDKISDVMEIKSGDGADVPQESLIGELSDIQKWVRLIPNDLSREDWIKMAAAIDASIGVKHPAEAFDLFSEFSEGWPANTPESIAQAWQSIVGKPHTVGANWIRDRARKHDPSLLADKFTVVEARPPAAMVRASAGRKRASPITRRYSTVQPEKIAWLSPGRFPFGKLSLLEGEPGVGKSTVLLDIAARLTRGEGLPGDPRVEPADVVILTAEDGIADTVRPRLDAARADVSRVHTLEGFDANGVVGDINFGNPNNPASLEALGDLIVSTSARLVIIDVIMAYLSGETDSYRDQDIRQALRPLSKLAETTGCAIIPVRHLVKRKVSGAINAGQGSVGLGGGARSVMRVDYDPKDPTRRILSSVKSNYAKPPSSLVYHLLDTPFGTSYVEWLGVSAFTAEALNSQDGEADGQSKTEECAVCLVEWLMAAPDGMDRKEVLRLGQAAGFSERTVDRASQQLGVLRRRSGSGASSRSLWALRPASLPIHEDPAEVMLTPSLDAMLVGGAV